MVNWNDITDPMGTDGLWEGIRKKAPTAPAAVAAPIPAPLVQQRVLDDIPRDELQEYGLAAPSAASAPVAKTGYEAEIERVSGLRDEAQMSAMEKLEKALNSQATISPSQGFAAALLAAIPTIGGAAIGGLVGKPKLPEGVYFPGMNPDTFGKTFGVGRNSALAQGAALGQQTSGDYVAGITKEQNDQIPLYLKAAEVEQKRADQLTNEEARLTQAQLAAQERKALQDDAQAARIEERKIALATAGRSDPLSGATPEQRAAILAQRSGIDAQGNPLPSVLGTETATRIGQQAAIARSAMKTADLIESSGTTWGELAAAKRLSAYDKDFINQRLQEILDTDVRFRSGAVATNQERAKIEGFIAGQTDLMTPAQVAAYLRNYGEIRLENARIQLEIGTSRNDPEGLRRQLETPARTSPPPQGDPVSQIMNDPSLSKAEKLAKLNSL